MRPTRRPEARSKPAAKPAPRARTRTAAPASAPVSAPVNTAPTGPQRLQKLLSQAGFGSRRDMDDAVAEGRVTVNGVRATPGTRVGPNDVVRLDRRTVRLEFDATLPRVILYHKPEGEIVSRDDPEGRPTVFGKLPTLARGRWVSLGRLDLNSEGLLVFTTSGELANRFTHPSYEVEREYAVRILGRVSPELELRLTTGVELEDGLARFDGIVEEGGEGANRWYRVRLHEGRNREVRRLFEAVGLTVSRLIRTRFGPITLPPQLKRGQWVELDNTSIAALLTGVELAPAKGPAPQREPLGRRAAPGKKSLRGKGLGRTS
jgi:23S rRNA pseudouridine2605 synthase